MDCALVSTPSSPCCYIKQSFPTIDDTLSLPPAAIWLALMGLALLKLHIDCTVEDFKRRGRKFPSMWLSQMSPFLDTIFPVDWFSLTVQGTCAIKWCSNTLWCRREVYAKWNSIAHHGVSWTRNETLKQWCAWIDSTGPAFICMSLVLMWCDYISPPGTEALWSMSL